MGRPADHPLQVKNIEAGKTLFIEVTAVASDALITASAEGVAAIVCRANSGEQHNTDAAVVANASEGIAEL